MEKQVLIRLFEDPVSPGVCRGCGEALDWRETLSGRRMPMRRGAVPLKSANDPDTHRVIGYFDAADAHWQSCPSREQFKHKEVTP